MRTKIFQDSLLAAAEAAYVPCVADSAEMATSAAYTQSGELIFRLSNHQPKQPNTGFDRLSLSTQNSASHGKCPQSCRPRQHDSSCRTNLAYRRSGLHRRPPNLFRPVCTYIWLFISVYLSGRLALSGHSLTLPGREGEGSGLVPPPLLTVFPRLLRTRYR